MLLAALLLAAPPQVEVEWTRDGDVVTKTVFVDGVLHRVSTATSPDCPVAYDVGGPLEIKAYHQSPAPGSPHTGDGPDGWQAPYVEPGIIREQFSAPSPLGWSYDGATVGNNIVQGSFTWPGVGPIVELESYPVDGDHVFDPDLVSLDSYEAIGAHTFAVLNAAHDLFWRAGFQEADGAAQFDNFGRGGVEGDPVLVEILHNYGNPKYIAGCYCFADDGESPVLQFWNWFNENLWPDRHVALDAGIIVHEYAHIVTARLLGAPLNADGTDNVQGRSLAEGLSDAYAMLWQAQPGDDPAWAHTIGAWPAYNFIGNGEWHDNYWFGVRTFPYSTDPNINPRHLGHFDPDAWPLPPDVPSSPLQIVQETGWHELGEIYAAFIWDIWAVMQDRYEFEDARHRMIATLVAAGKLAPLLPNFADMRDAVIEADAILNKGENWAPIWYAAAKRGMGAGAVIPDSSVLSPVAPSFVTVDFGDWNEDGVVDVLDGVAFQVDTTGGTLRADLNLDHKVDVLDWVLWWEAYLH